MNIKAIREQLMLTQQEFADLVGVSITTIGNWELGIKQISLKHKRKVVEICKKEGIVWQDTK